MGNFQISCDICCESKRKKESDYDTKDAEIQTDLDFSFQNETMERRNQTELVNVRLYNQRSLDDVSERPTEMNKPVRSLFRVQPYQESPDNPQRLSNCSEFGYIEIAINNHGLPKYFGSYDNLTNYDIHHFQKENGSTNNGIRAEESPPDDLLLNLDASEKSASFNGK